MRLFSLRLHWAGSPFLCLDTAVTYQLVQGERGLHFSVVCLRNSLTNNFFPVRLAKR